MTASKKKRKKKEPESLYELADDLLGDAKLGVNFWFPTGFLTLDLAISNGLGLPGGKMVEIYGDSGSAKSSLCLKICKEAQALGGTVIWLDAEAALSLSLAEEIIGIDTQHNFIYKIPDTLENAIESIEKLGSLAAAKGEPVVIVLDSIAALSTKAQSIDGGDFASTKRVMGSAANTISWFGSRGILRKLAGSPVLLLIINQTRTKVDFFSYGGPKKTTPGGVSISFYSRVRLELSTGPLKEGDVVVGKQMAIEVVKNSFGPDGNVAYIPLYPSMHNDIVGFDEDLSCVNYLVARNVLKRNGSWYSLAGDNKRKNEWVEAMRENPNLRSSIRDLVRAEYLGT